MGNIYAQGGRCENIQPFCAGSSQFVFPNSNATNGDVAVAEAGPNYRCLNTQPYPAWFYLQIEKSGNLNFKIKQTVNADGSGGTLDVDYIAWGPFKVGESLCGSSVLSSSRVVDCSYSPSATENFDIRNAIFDQIYVVMITNYSEKKGFISLEQTNLNQPNSGTTDCSIVNILGEDLSLCDRSPVELVASNVIATRYEYYVLDENLGDFVLISNQVSPKIIVSTSGIYKVIAVNDETGLILADEISIQYFDKPIAISPQDLQSCSNDVLATFDLLQVYEDITQDSQNIGSNFILKFYSNDSNFANSIAIENPTTFKGIDEQEIIATIINEESECVSNPVRFNLKLAAIPEIAFQDLIVFCVDEDNNILNPKELGEDLGSNFIYSWSVDNDPDGDGIQNPILVITEMLELSEISLEIQSKITGCSINLSTEISYYSAPTEVLVNVSGNDFEDGYVVTANVINSGNTNPEYEYQLDEGSWQANATFNRVKPGLHTVTVRDVYGCGMAVSENFRLIGYPRFFTPNGDGYNDNWQVINDPEMSISNIFIYDRYGKLLKQLDPRGTGWDGNYNGQIMTADDYWFTVNVRDQITGIVSEFTGHFTLKL